MGLVHRRSVLAYFATLVPLFGEGKTESIRGRLKLAAPGKPMLAVSAAELIPLRGDESTMGVLLDPRVRDMDFELIGTPTSMGAFEVGPIHTRAMYVHKGGQKLFVTYWCDICFIRTYTPGSCWCCQEDTELDLRDRYDN